MFYLLQERLHHYYRLNQEIELINEARENKINAEKEVNETKNTNNNLDPTIDENISSNRAPRRKRGFQAKEKELSVSNSNDEIRKEKNIKDTVVEPQLDIN